MLKGAVLSLPNIELIQFEFGGANLDARTTFQDFWYFLKEFNYSIFIISCSGIRELEQYSEIDEIYVATNYLAARRIR